MWEKQKEAIKFVLKRKDRGTCLFMEMGTGKTRVMVEVIDAVRAQEPLRLGLIVAPLSVMHVWIENWYDWSDEPVLFVDLHETGPAGLRKAYKLAKGGQLVICLINYEATWQFGHKRIERIRNKKPVRILEPVDTTLFDVKWDFIIADESTAIKNPSAKVTKFFISKLAPMARYKYALTGSAYLKRPLDVYTQIKFVSGTAYMPQTYTQFKYMYSIPHPEIRGAILGYKNLRELVARMARCCVLLKKEEVLDLPPTLHETRIVTLPPKVKALYDTVRNEQYAELEELENAGKTITVAHVFAVQRKLLQIASGFVIPDATDEELAEKKKAVPLVLHSEKVNEILEILDQRGGKPTVVVTQSNCMEDMLVRAVRKQFNFTPKVLNGSVKGAEARHNMIAEAAKDMVFIVKEAVGCEGTDMKYADMTIWAEHAPNTSDYVQMMSRNHRGGQTKKITYVHILANVNAEKRVMKILANDQDVAAEIERDWRALLA